MKGFGGQPYSIGPVERDERNYMFIRCEIREADGHIEWLISPSLAKTGAISCSGATGISGLSSRRAKALMAKYQAAVYRECGKRFKREIEQTEAVIVS